MEKHQIMDGYTPKKDLARAFDVSERTIARWIERLHVRTVRVPGRDELVDDTDFRAKVMGENRGRGRPRRKAA